MHHSFIKHFLLICLFCYSPLSIGMKRKREEDVQKESSNLLIEKKRKKTESSIGTCLNIPEEETSNQDNIRQQQSDLSIKKAFTFLEEKLEKEFLPQQKNPVTVCLLSPCGKYIVTGIDNNSLNLWSLESKINIGSINIVPLLSQANLHLLSAVFSPDDKYLFAKTDTNFIFQHNIQNQCTTRIELENYNTVQNIISTNFSSSGNYMLAEASDKFVIWDTSSGTICNEINISLKEASDQITCIALAPNEKHILIATAQNKIMISKIKNYDPKPYKDIINGNIIDMNARICHLLFHSKDKLMIGTELGLLMLYNTSIELKNFIVKKYVKTTIDNMKFSPDGKYFAAFIRPDSLFIWNTETGHGIKRIVYEKTTPNSFSFNHNSTQIVVGLNDGKTICISLAGMEMIKKLKKILSMIKNPYEQSLLMQ